MVPLHLMLAALIRWIAGEQQEVIEYLRAENRVLKAQLRGRRERLSYAERRRLALLGARLGRPILTGIRSLDNEWLDHFRGQHSHVPACRQRAA